MIHCNVKVEPTMKQLYKRIILFTGVLYPMIALPQGPGLGNLTYTDEELFEVIWMYEDPTHYGSNVATMINGYMVTTLAPDGGKPPGGILVFDVSDPKNPELVKRIYNEQTAGFRESHAFGHYRNYIALQDGCGIQIWDFENPRDPKQVVRYCMDGYSHDDYGSAWQLFWQAPYIFVANGSSGYDIIDASDVANPRKIKHVNVGQQVGPIFAIGNMLITTAHNQGAGYAISDISDPENPVLINSGRNGLQNIYAASFNGYQIISSARGNRINSIFTVHDVKNPNTFNKINEIDIDNEGAQLYNTTQDNYVIQGCQTEIVKVDVSDPDQFRIVGRGGIDVPSSDHGQVTPFGNLIFVGNDHGSGSGFIVHQKEPDTKGPVVNMISPDPHAVNQALTSRIGMTFTDNVDLNSVNKQTFIVRPIGGGEALAGSYSHQFATVNFSPDEPLLPNTTYEIVIPKNGLIDWVGNATEHDFVSYFSTKDEINTKPATPLNFTAVGKDDRIKLFWDAFDGAEQYQLEKSATLDGDFEVLASPREANWIDQSVVKGQTYYYRLLAKNANGNSTLTPIIPALAKTIILPPATPISVLALGEQDQVKLSWEASNNAELYHVYRAQTPEGSYHKIAETSELNLTDSDTQDAEEFYYKIIAITADMQSQESSKTKAVLGEFTYLSDLDWIDSENGWGDVEKDRSNGELAPDDGAILTINQVAYQKGLGVHAYSSIEYQLDEHYQTFLTDVGVDDETNGNGSVVFEIWVDDVKKYESTEVVTGNRYAQRVEVDVEGADKMKLVVTDGGNGVGSDHGNWTNARLTPAPAPAPPLPPKSVLALGEQEQVKLSWEASNNAELYHIYRAQTPEGSYHKIAETSELNLTDFDTQDAEEFYYKIIAITADVQSKESLRTKAVLGEFTYLSDLHWIDSENGRGDVEKDRSNGELAPDDGAILTINQVAYQKGLGVHAYSSIEYQLDKHYQTFLTDVGVDDETNGNGSVVFEIWVDGVKKHESTEVVKGNKYAQRVEIDVEGADKMKLVVTDGGNGVGSDHGNWANARLTPAPPITALREDMYTSIVVYPNPGQGYMKILGIPENEFVELNIVDLSSRLVRQELNYKSGGSLDIRGLSSGLYVLKIEGKDFSVEKRIIIQD